MPRRPVSGALQSVPPHSRRMGAMDAPASRRPARCYYPAFRSGPCRHDPARSAFRSFGPIQDQVLPLPARASLPSRGNAQQGERSEIPPDHQEVLTSQVTLNRREQFSLGKGADD